MTKTGNPLINLADQLKAETVAALRAARPVLSLSFVQDAMNGQGYHRRYLLANVQDGSKTLFLTTNEVPDDPFAHVPLGAHFTVLNGFDGLMEELQANSPVRYFDESVHGPPKYVYYDIELMDDPFKPLFLSHLEREVNGLAVDYLAKYFTLSDMERMKYWRIMLANK
jgi:hypothetical protein